MIHNTGILLLGTLVYVEPERTNTRGRELMKIFVYSLFVNKTHSHMRTILSEELITLVNRNLKLSFVTNHIIMIRVMN